MSSLKGLIENVPDYLHTKERDGKRIRDALGLFRSQVESLSSTVTGITGGTTDLSGYFKLAGRSSQQAITNNFPARHILYIQPSAAQSGDLIRVRDYTNTYNAFSIDAGSLVTVSETTATDDTVRFQIRVPTTQTQNISQVVRAFGGGNYTAWSIGSTGANVFGDNTANGAAVIRLRINQGSGQSVDMFQIRNTADTISLASVDSLARWDIRPVGSGTTTPSLAIRRTTAAAAPIQEWQNTSGTAIARVDGSGRIIGGVNALSGTHTLTSTGSIIAVPTATGGAGLASIFANTVGWSGSEPTNGLWRLEPTLSDPGSAGLPGVGNTTMFRINATVSDNAGTQTGLEVNVDISDDSAIGGGGDAQGLDFNVQTSGTGSFAGIVGATGNALHTSSGTLTNLIGANFFVRSTGGNITNAYGMKPDCLISAGTISNFYSTYCGIPTVSGSGAVTTAYGVYIEDKISGIGTLYSIYSVGGQSHHRGGMVHSFEPISSSDTDAVATVADNYYWHMVDHTILTGTQSIVLEGDAILQVT